jgi:hypothetical protein
MIKKFSNFHTILKSYQFARFPDYKEDQFYKDLNVVSGCNSSDGGVYFQDETKLGQEPLGGQFFWGQLMNIHAENCPSNNPRPPSSFLSFSCHNQCRTMQLNGNYCTDLPRQSVVA